MKTNYTLDHVLKICLIGVPDDLMVRLMDKFVEPRTDNDLATIGARIYTKILEINGHKVKLLLIVISSYTHFDRLRKTYFEGGFGGIFAYDKAKPNSIEVISEIISEAQQTIGETGIFTLVGINTKSELISTDQGQQLAKKMNVKFYEIEEKNLLGFVEIIKEITSLFETRNEDIKQANKI
ncbi:MAG: hypothetical protein ACFFC6_17330 [Promethearchaeota archaeon]